MLAQDFPKLPGCLPVLGLDLLITVFATCEGCKGGPRNNLQKNEVVDGSRKAMTIQKLLIPPLT